MSLSELTGGTRTIPMKASGKKRILPLGLFVGGQDEQSWKIRGLEGRENSCRGRGWRASRLLSSDLGQAYREPDPPFLLKKRAREALGRCLAYAAYNASSLRTPDDLCPGKQERDGHLTSGVLAIRTDPLLGSGS